MTADSEDDAVSQRVESCTIGTGLRDKLIFGFITSFIEQKPNGTWMFTINQEQCERLILSLLLLLTTGACGFTPRPINLKTSATPNARNFSIGEPVFVTWALVNTTAEPIRVNLGAFSREHFVIRIKDPSGNSINAARLHPSGYHSVGIFTIEPAATLTQHLVLNRWAVFPKMGIYSIQIGIAERPVRVRDNAPLDGDFIATVEIEFFARNEERLKQRYGDLYRRLIEANSADEASTFATALGLAGDELTIPFLAQALANRRLMVEQDVISALARIGTQQAADVLIPYVNDPKDLISVNARTALIEIRDKTTDAKLKRQISKMRIEELKPVYKLFGRP